MENVALLEELASADELEELYELDASESDPEDDEDGNPSEQPLPAPLHRSHCGRRTCGRAVMHL